jgi:HEAT repeats
VIESLAAFTGNQAFQAVVKSLTHSRKSVRKAAVATLGKMKTDAAIDALIEQLPEASAEERAAIVRSMGTSCSPRAFPIIVQSLATRNTVIWRAALDAIVNYPAEQAAKVLRPYAATDPDLDFREAVAVKLVEDLDQPIEIDWLTPVIKSRKGSDGLGDAPGLVLECGGDRAVPMLLSCLDFEDPTVWNSYNSKVIEEQIPCRGRLAIPWHGELNRNGTAAETEENRQTLRKIKAWVDYCLTHGSKAGLRPQDLQGEEGEKEWGEGVDDLSIRAWVNRDVWPAGLPQVVSFAARDLPGEDKQSSGTIHFFPSMPAALEVEVNSEWYTLAKDADLSVCGRWHINADNLGQDLQLDGRWRRKSDGRPLELKPGKYTVRVGVSRTPVEKRTGLATSKPIKFEIIPTK